MLFKSIRWSLQIWYGVILIVILAGFGFTAYEFERARAFQDIEHESQRRMVALLSGLGHSGPGNGPPEDQPDFQNRPEHPNRPPPPEDADAPEGERPPPPRGEFKLAPRDLGLFGNGEPGAFFYIVWRRDGREMGSSPNAPKDIRRPPSVIGSMSGGFHIANGRAEAFSYTPLGECLLTGRSLAPDLAGLRRFAWSLTGIGAIVMLCGLAGGWLLAGRVIRPIEDISAAALKISGGDLSRRIDVENTEDELGRLADVLNSTFARLETAFAQQGQFTADAAHELRTPVSVILTQTQTALKHERSAADYRETIEACQRSAQRMRRLLESLLELARLDAGQEPMKRLRFDLARTVSEGVELVRPLAAERGIKIESELPALEFVGDSERLAQVIANLLANAIHYNRENGQVRVTLQRQNNAAVVTVSDTGLGIAAADLPHIFNRFYRGDKARSNAAGRTGLGLAISQAIVTAHGGVVEVSSQPGSGAKFTVRLPDPT
jgi:two-component system OmpR family sensor kinase